VFEQFFAAWDARGGGTITAGNIDDARGLFVDVAEPLLARLPEPDGALERARLFGSAISVGMADVVLGLEASRPADVRERWLEYRFEGDFSLGDPGGRRVALRGIIDRVDLLDGRRLRVIDYKSGSAPDPKRALQVPIYALSALELLAARDGGSWEVEDAAYVAFTGKRTLVPVAKRGGDAKRALADARERLFAVADGVSRGEFPPRPHDRAICSYCAFEAVCRKDYAGDE
jgi:RecB family exonuclease